MKERGQTYRQLSFIEGGVIPGEVRQFKVKVHRTRPGSPGLTPGSPQTVLRKLPRDPGPPPQASERRAYRPCCFDHSILMTWVPIEGSLGRWVCPQCPGD